MVEIYHSYRAYGLNIHSDMLLPELEAAQFDVSDVVIRHADLYRTFSISHGNKQTFSPNCQQMDWGMVGRFEIRGDAEILYSANPGTPDSIVRFPLLGTVMAMLLQIRGTLGLHASAVMINGKAVGFMGDKGAGKSTTAGLMVSTGKALLADDLLAIRATPEVVCYPGFAQMKLTDPSAETLKLRDVEILDKIDFPGLEKRQHNLTSHFHNQPAPLGAIYILERGAAPEIVPLDSMTAFQMLMRYTHFKRFGAPALATGAAPALMHACSIVAKTGAVHKLIVPDSLDALHEAADMIDQSVRL
jgi:hypothetical protein